MTYAYIIEGLDAEQRETIDRSLAADTGGDTKAQARRERDAIASLMGSQGAVVRK